ncbi:hypothetical protein B0T25DRAFT_27083 [Lasiosphaeria hispida]|uniref:IBR domain-containing protein n=1 Tax=Lasiosphaeria hispida TaxID=260671 RepID=A0AAJ0MJP8_9PEZI|nr:hypothetical protein B0T25DRAFT_27083 [Lasiosphaeria hispida]
MGDGNSFGAPEVLQSQKTMQFGTPPAGQGGFWQPGFQMFNSFLSSPASVISRGWSQASDSTLNTPATSIRSSPSPSPCPPLSAGAARLGSPDPFSPLSPLSTPGFSSPSPRTIVPSKPLSSFLPSQTSCASCTTPIPRDGTHTLGCGHTNCRDCLRKAAMNALDSAALGAPFVPAACCGTTTVPLAVIGTVTTPAEFAAYQARLVESSMPAPQRLYCHDAACGMFITPGQQRSKSGTCPLCLQRTCAMCGRKTHMFPCEPGAEFYRPRGDGGWLGQNTSGSIFGGQTYPSL